MAVIRNPGFVNMYSGLTQDCQNSQTACMDYFNGSTG
jgi:hypothetical protein